MKLYRSNNNPGRWYAHIAGTGWVMFPAAAGGWERREPARGLDPVDIREVPVALGHIAGVPDSANALSVAA